jgi:hypothetical protein
VYSQEHFGQGGRFSITASAYPALHVGPGPERVFENQVVLTGHGLEWGSPWAQVQEVTAGVTPVAGPSDQVRRIIRLRTLKIKLVSRVRNPVQTAGEAFEDLVYGLRPDVGLRVGVACGDPVADVLFRGLDRPVNASPYLLAGQFGEPSLDEVQPGRAGRCEVQVEPGVGRQVPVCRA